MDYCIKSPPIKPRSPNIINLILSRLKTLIGENILFHRIFGYYLILT
jgi:hypothetical protein